MTADDEPITPEPPGPFYSNYGPRDGLILRGDAPVMGVLDGQGAVVGIAWLAGSIPSKRGPAQLWRLEVRKVPLEGQWVCRCRQFLRIGEAAEEV